MKMKRLILAGTLALSCALPAIANPAGQWVKQTGVDDSYPTSSTNPFPVTLAGTSTATQAVDVTKTKGVALSAANPINTQLSVGNVAASAANPVPVSLAASTGTSNVNVAAINGVTPLMGNGASGTGAQRVTIASDSTGQISLVIASAAVSATNGLFANQLQGNAVLSATNGGYQNMLLGNVAVSQTNPLPTTVSTLATASIVNAAADIVTTTSTVVSLGVTSRKITVKNCDTTAVMNVDIKAGTASVSNGVRLDPGIAYTFTPALGASSFSYYSTAPASATKTLTYVAE